MRPLTSALSEERLKLPARPAGRRSRECSAAAPQLKRNLLGGGVRRTLQSSASEVPMHAMSRYLAVVGGALFLATAIPDAMPAQRRPAPLPTDSGFYYAGQGRYRRLPGCSGDECASCVPRAWLGAARNSPIDGHGPVFLLRSLLVNPQTPQRDQRARPARSDTSVISVVTVRVDSTGNHILNSVVDVVDPNGAVSLSFTENLAAGTYVVIQGFPGAERYGTVRSTTGSLCWIALDQANRI